MKHVLLLVNPTSGMGAAEECLFDIINAFAENNCITTVVLLLQDGPVSSEETLKEACGRYDIIACFGGDGTLSHLIDNYIQLSLPQPLGYLPAGSTNDFAHSLGIPVDSVEGAAVIASGEVFRYDAGVFNGRHFNYIAAFGAFTKVAYNTNQMFKNILGYAAYLLSALASVAESVNIRCPMVIEHDGIRKEDTYIFGAVSNSASIGGFRISFQNEVRMDDGLFEVILIRSPENIVDLTQIIGCLMTGSIANSFIETFQTRALTIYSASKAAWTLDGEYGGEPERVDISCLRQRLPILVKPKNELQSTRQEG